MSTTKPSVLMTIPNVAPRITSGLHGYVKYSELTRPIESDARSYIKAQEIYRPLVYCPNPRYLFIRKRWPAAYARRKIKLITEQYTKQRPFSVAMDSNSVLIRDMYTKCNDIYFIAFDRAMGEVNSVKGELAMTLINLDKTFDMIGSRAHQIAHSYVALRRGNRRKAMRILNPKHYSKYYAGRRIPTELPVSNLTNTKGRVVASEHVLEWNYGVAPLLSDINASTKIIVNDLQAATRTVKGTSRTPIEIKTSKVNNRTYDSFTQIVKGQGLAKCRVQFTVKVIDAKGALMEQLGLINPGLAINDRIPFSFIVNYWTNHEKWLTSLSAMYGMSMLEPQTTYISRLILDDTLAYHNKLDSSANYVSHHGFYIMDMHRFMSVRTPQVQERFRLVPSSSLRRTVNTIALLNILLGGKHNK